MHLLQTTLKGGVVYTVQPKIRFNSRMEALDVSSLLMTDMLPVIGALWIHTPTCKPFSYQLKLTVLHIKLHTINL